MAVRPSRFWIRGKLASLAERRLLEFRRLLVDSRPPMDSRRLMDSRLLVDGPLRDSGRPMDSRRLMVERRVRRLLTSLTSCSSSDLAALGERSHLRVTHRGSLGNRPWMERRASLVGPESRLPEARRARRGSSTPRTSSLASWGRRRGNRLPVEPQVSQQRRTRRGCRLPVERRVSPVLNPRASPASAPAVVPRFRHLLVELLVSLLSVAHQEHRASQDRRPLERRLMVERRASQDRRLPVVQMVCLPLLPRSSRSSITRLAKERMRSTHSSRASSPRLLADSRLPVDNRPLVDSRPLANNRLLVTSRRLMASRLLVESHPPMDSRRLVSCRRRARPQTS